VEEKIMKIFSEQRKYLYWLFAPTTD
jgi:hypothetical protein